MKTNQTHDIELYAPEVFNVLLEYEVNRSRRYPNPLTLIHMAIKTQPETPEIQHSAEVAVINVLNLHLRGADIPCKKGNEYFMLLPITTEQGGRTVCERLMNLLKAHFKTTDGKMYTILAYIGMTSFIGGSAITSKTLMEQAATALQHARAQEIPNAKIYSDIT